MFQGISHGAEDLLRHWEDYRFMAYYQGMNTRTHDGLSDAGSDTLHRLGKLPLCPSRRIFPGSMSDGPLEVSMEALSSLRALLIESPHLAHIFQARWLIYHPRFSVDLHMTPKMSAPAELFFIRILLDLSWDDMRTAICLLRPIIGENPQKFREMLLFMPTLCSEIRSESFTSRDLALGYLRQIEKSRCVSDSPLKLL
jgi:hypothetical protein